MDESESSETPAFLHSIRYIVNGDQLPSISASDLNLPPEICDGFWSLNTHNQRLSTPSDTLLMSYCPHMIGPCCTPVRRQDYLRLLRSLTFWICLTQTVLYIVALTETKLPILSLNIDRNILIRYGAITPSSLQQTHQYWRLLSNFFINGSLSQLFVNVGIQLIFVMSREASWNLLRLGSIFFSSGICGTFFSLSFSPELLAVGSSGGIFGVFGAFCSMYGILFESLQWKHRIAVLFLLFLNALLLIFTTTQTYSGNWGHAGALAFGVALGLVIFASRSAQSTTRFGLYLAGGVISFLLMLVPVVYFHVRGGLE
jgi:rhomboid protease GluP